MDVEFFQIREDDTEILEQISALEGRLNGFMDYFETVMFARHNRIYAAVDGDALLGCCFFVRNFDAPEKAFLYSVNMAKRSRTLIRRLLEIAFKDLKASGIDRIEVFVEPTNVQALRAYREDYGFEIAEAAEDETAVSGYIVLNKAI